jgi:hypothetical protein
MDYGTLKEAIDAGRVSHTRAGDGLYRGSTLVYELRADSPSGVQLLGVVDDSSAAARLLRGSLSPLSPVEPR